MGNYQAQSFIFVDLEDVHEPLRPHQQENLLFVRHRFPYQDLIVRTIQYLNIAVAETELLATKRVDRHEWEGGVEMFAHSKY